MRLLRLRRGARHRRTGRRRGGPPRRSGSAAGDQGLAGGREGPAGPRGRLRSPDAVLVEASRGPVRGHRPRERPPSGEDGRARAGTRRAGRDRLSHPRLTPVLRSVPARIRPPRAVGRRRRDQRRRFRAVHRSAVHQGAGPGRIGRLASGRHHPLGQPRMGRGHPRLQLHGPALRQHSGQRGMGRPRHPSARQGGHPGDGRGGRVGAAARRGPDRLPTGRCGHDEPAGAARFVREHEPRLAGDGQLRIPPPRLGAGSVRRRPAHSAPAVYDEERIRTRSRLVGYAIDARRQRFPDETSFVYRPFADSGEHHPWNAEAKAGLKDYNLLDFSI